MKFKILFFLVFSSLIQKINAQCSMGCVNVQLRNTGTTLEVWLMPTTATHTGVVTTTFTISWDASYQLDLGTPTSILAELPISIGGTGSVTTDGGRKYSVYAATGTGNTTLTTSTAVQIMTVPVTGMGSTNVVNFSINNDTYTTTNNYNYYFEVGGDDLTGTTSSIANNIVLSVNLRDFKALEKYKTVELSWKTTDERNFSHFELERSNDAKNWQKIAVLKGGNTEGGYFFNDNTVFEGTNTAFYRLKMIDRDGRFGYSKTLSVASKTAVEKPLAVFPNPTGYTLEVVMNVPTDSQKVFDIIDASGKLHQRETVRLQRGQNQISFSISELPTGIYFLKTAGQSTVKFSKQ